MDAGRSANRSRAVALKRLALSLMVGRCSILIPWLAAKTEAPILADATAMLLLPGMLPGLVVGFRPGGCYAVIGIGSTMPDPELCRYRSWPSTLQAVLFGLIRHSHALV